MSLQPLRKARCHLDSGRARRAHPLRARGLAICALLLLLAFDAFAPGQALSEGAAISGQIVAVKDGDSLVLLSDGREIEVRLAEVDAPEFGQPYGRRAKEALSVLAFGRDAKLEVVDHDRYGRTVARVIVGDVDVNREMVRTGAAWVYRDYAHRIELYDVESEARRAGLGLWALPESERDPPWQWRRQHPRDKAHLGMPDQTSQSPPPAPQLAPGHGAGTPPGAAPKPAPFECGTKRYCREMVSCEEARFYLTHCRAARLDGDGDGRPCEVLCKR